MTVARAVAIRTLNLLKDKNMTQYQLEKLTGIQHGTMQCIMNGRTKSIYLTTVMLISKGFSMSVLEFLDDEIFRSENLELEY
ncbi:MAG: helix-turn-helix transcriptional regulator [Clostridia bacterium]|nr:helix-turn-helix transcriptional regulator [Clostridia bacterium]